MPKTRNIFNQVLGDWTSYTPPTTNGLGTITSTLFQRREGDSLRIYGNLSTGTVTAAIAKFALPTGLTIDTTKLSSSANGQRVGWFIDTAGNVASIFGSSNEGVVFVIPSDTSTLYLTNATNSGYTQQNATGFLGSNRPYSFEILVPISGWDAND